MDIEDLSKAQLLLLTVMVNFVVSIATGVLTVSLLDQAPLPVSQGVDHIVEKTIQTIATPVQVVNPIKSITAPATPAPTTEERMTAAVGDAVARTVLIHKNSTSTPAVAFGTYLPSSHAVVTATVQGLPKEALIEFSDGSALRASLSRNSEALTIYGFADDATLPGAPDADLVALAKLKQGQTAIALTKDSAALTGIISKVGDASIQTDLTTVPVGGAVVDLDGSVIGIESTTPGTLTPTDAVTKLLQAAPKS
jgi:hypothetical protein